MNARVQIFRFDFVVFVWRWALLGGRSEVDGGGG